MLRGLVRYCTSLARSRVNSAALSGTATADVCRKHGISSATFYKWKAKYGGLEVSDAKRLKALKDENAKLKKLLAEAMLERHAQGCRRKKMVTPAARREAVAHLRTLFEVRERRACKVLEADRTSVRYRGQRAHDAIVRARLRELAASAAGSATVVCLC